jgi:uncharacterized RDD family membrane protein YckC
MLDTSRRLETPEGIELGLEVAGPVPRAVAWLIDLLLRGLVYIALALALGTMGRFGEAMLLLLLFLLEWFYPVIGEVWFGGVTPGKRMLGLRVIHDDGTPVRFSASMVRNLVRAIDFLPLFYAAGLFCMLFHRDFKRLGDIAAGTLVVYGESGQDNSPRAAAPAQAPAWPLTPDEQQTLLNFAERRRALTDERADELARAAGVLVADTDQPAQRLQSYASWVAGEA